MILYVFILFFVRVLCDENVTEVTNFVTTDKFVEKIERTVQPLNFSGGLIKGEKKITDFKPSPQLDVEYEYNKFPVVPAHPEAKRSKIQNEYYTSTESTYPWRIKFPAPERERERPYKFYNENEERPSKFYNENEESPSYTSKNFQKNEDISFQKHVPIRQNSYDNIYKEPEEKYSYNMMERPSPIQKTGGYGGIGGHYGENPWKKIIKILTAFIPIGLIISALTPTVITVTNANDTTHSRYRLEDKNVDLKKKLLTSITFFEGLKAKGCEERMICELLLAASTSPNAQENVKNFLDNFSEREDIMDKTEDLKKIFAAVRHQDCSPITCENIQNPP